MTFCPCGLEKNVEECCLPIIEGTAKAASPEALMRARYTSHALQKYDFLTTSTHPEFRNDASEDEIKEWSSNMDWERLEIISTSEGGSEDETGRVNFVAHYSVKGYPQELREDAFFRKEGEDWYYVDGTVYGKEPVKREGPKVGRNDACPCGSGKKFKKCCINA